MAEVEAGTRVRRITRRPWRKPTAGSRHSTSATGRRSIASRTFCIQVRRRLPLLVLIGSVAIFCVIDGRKFFSPFALTLILQQVAIVGIVGSAQTLVILTAGIDLSVGAILVLCSVVMGKFSVTYGLPPVLGWRREWCWVSLAAPSTDC